MILFSVYKNVSKIQSECGFALYTEIPIGFINKSQLTKKEETLWSTMNEEE